METHDFKVCRAQARKVAQDVLMLVWFENGIIQKKPSPELAFVPEITNEFLNDLFSLVLIESAINEFVWDDFLKRHIERMTTTPYLFANYFAYASYILMEGNSNAHACFVDILSLASHFSLQYWQENDKNGNTFLKCCVDLFSAFFDKELCTLFENQGSWKNFNEYLRNHGTLKKYKELTRENWTRNDVFNEFLTEHRERLEPYVINGVVLRDITEIEVENLKCAVSFADSVGDKLKEACNKEFEEVLKDFPKTDNEVEKLYRKAVGAASGGMPNAEDQSFSQEAPEEALENVPSKTNPEKSDDPSRKVEACDPLNTPDTGSSKSQDQSNKKLSTEPQEYVSIPKSNVERAKSLLEEMKNDIAKMSELIRFVCEENAIQVPKQVVNPTKKM